MIDHIYFVSSTLCGPSLWSTYRFTTNVHAYILAVFSPLPIGCIDIRSLIRGFQLLRVACNVCPRTAVVMIPHANARQRSSVEVQKTKTISNGFTNPKTPKPLFASLLTFTELFMNYFFGVLFEVTLRGRPHELKTTLMDDIL